MGYYKVKCSLCSVQQVWWSLHWVPLQAGQVVCRGFDFVGLWSFSEEGAALGNHSAQNPASV